VMKANIDTMAAAGGGDGPEAVTAGLHEVNQLGWRPNASKVCVFIADAPPHGLGEDGDGFPEGCPLGHDPVAICREMASKGIVVYSIGVEPVLSTSYKFARDFMMMVATVTEGKFLPLGKADVLAEVIVSTAIEGLELEQLWVSVEESVKRDAAAKAEVLTAEDLCKRVEERIAEKKESKEVQVRKVAVANPYMDARYDMCNVQQMAQAPSLQAARAQFKSSANAHVAQETASYGWGQQVAMCMDPRWTRTSATALCSVGTRRLACASKPYLLRFPPSVRTYLVRRLVIRLSFAPTAPFRCPHRPKEANHPPLVEVSENPSVLSFFFSFWPDTRTNVFGLAPCPPWF